MKISVFCEKNTDKIAVIEEEVLQNLAEKLSSFALNELRLKDFPINVDYDFEVLLTDNDFIHQINNEYRQKDCPTDVITFALYADSEPKFVLDDTIQLGQIIISLDKVVEQAKDNAISEKEELLNLLSHGILHLLGIDHPDDGSLEYMLSLQNKMIESINHVKI